MKVEFPCQKRRTFFDLFKLYSCKECILSEKNEYYVIGEVNVNVYYLNRCILNENNIFDKKLKILLKDAILNQDNNIIVWLDNFNFEMQQEIILNLLAFDFDVQIISS